MVVPPLKSCNQFSDGILFINDNAIVQNDLRKRGVFCDLIVSCNEGIKVPVHKIVLCGGSDYFLDLLTSNMQAIPADSIELNISSSVFEKIVSFIYTGEIKAKTPAELEEIAKHACYFQLPPLVDLCSSSLEQFVSSDTCLKYWRFAQTNCMKKLGNFTFQYILNNANKLLKSSVFLNKLSISEIKQILGDSQLRYGPEVIFELILQWLKARCSNEECLGMFSECVPIIDFHLMSKQFLLSKVLPNKDLMRIDIVREKMIECAKYKWEEESNIQLQAISEPLPEYVPLPQSEPKNSLIAVMGSDLLKIDDHGELAQYINLNEAKNIYSCTTFKNLLFISGGTINSEETNTCEYFSPANQKWTKFSSMSTKRCQHASDYVNGNLYVCGGRSSGRSIEMYDFKARKWCPGPFMNAERCQFGLCSTNNVLYAVGGVQSSGIERWDVRTPGWTCFLQENNITAGVTRCIYKNDIIYCFGRNRDYIFECRMNKLRGKRDVRLRYQYDVTLLNDEFASFAVERSKNNSKTLNLRFCHFTQNGEIVNESNKKIDCTLPNIELISLNC